MRGPVVVPTPLAGSCPWPRPDHSPCVRFFLLRPCPPPARAVFCTAIQPPTGKVFAQAPFLVPCWLVFAARAMFLCMMLCLFCVLLSCALICRWGRTESSMTLCRLAHTPPFDGHVPATVRAKRRQDEAQTAVFANLSCGLRPLKRLRTKTAQADIVFASSEGFPKRRRLESQIC